DVAGLAEALFGAGKGLSPIFYITIGSGIGGGLIINGEIYRGCGRGAAEIGHFKLADHSREHGKPNWIVEDEASGWSIARKAREKWTASERLRELAHHDCEALTAEHVAQAALVRDETAWAILDQARAALAEGITAVITLLSPRRIVIGGGVSHIG